MVVKAEVKYKVIFQSKYEDHSQKSMFYQQAFDFSVFRQISGFSEKKFFEIFVYFCEKMQEAVVGMTASCRCCTFIYYRTRSLL